MNEAKRSGDRGEQAAAAYLRHRGCEILDTQWHCRYGELDLVARDGAYLCFVEVKLRGPRSIALPREFVDARKQEKLRRAALAWMSEHHLSDAFARFDVAEVYEESDGSLRLEYLESAFT